MKPPNQGELIDVQNMRNDMILAPSILSADFAHLHRAVDQCIHGGAQWLHVDVMDNQFVPNLTIGPPVVKSIRPLTEKYIDVHMMVINPEKLIKPFALAGADGITFHIEATDNPQGVINLIKDTRKHVGISLKPDTHIKTIEPFLDQIDLVLVMSVEPGFGGQGFLPESLDKITELKQLIKEQCLQDKVKIEVDGGIKLQNAREVLKAGADILVSGSGIFHTEDPVQIMKAFYTLGDE